MVESVALELLLLGVGGYAHIEAGIVAREAGEAGVEPERGERLRGRDRQRLLPRLREVRSRYLPRP